MESNNKVEDYLEDVKRRSQEYVKIEDVLKLLEPVKLAGDINYNVADINGLESKKVAQYIHSQMQYKLIGK